MDLQKLFAKSGKKPQSILKIVLGFSFILLVMWLFLVSKMDTGSVADKQTEKTEEVSERTIGLHRSLAKADAEADSANSAPANKQSVQKKDSADLFQNALVTFLVMVGMLGAIWFWSKKKEGQATAKSSSREIDAHQLSESSQLKFLEINEEIWVVGLSENGMDLLHRYPRSEWKEGALEQADAPSKGLKETAEKNGSMDFKSLLKVVSN